MPKAPVSQQRSPEPGGGLKSPQYPSAHSKSIANSFTSASVSASVAGDQNWIVGFGFESNSSGQYEELFGALSACGTITKVIRGGNWVAVQYSSPYAAEKATLSQPIFSPSTNTYFGIDRVTPDRLRMLKLHKSTTAETLALENGGKADDQRPKKTFDAYPKQQFKLIEGDVLLDESMDEDGMERPKQPRNICEQLMALVFRWSYDADLVSSDKMHTD